MAFAQGCEPLTTQREGGQTLGLREDVGGPDQVHLGPPPHSASRCPTQPSRCLHRSSWIHHLLQAVFPDSSTKRAVSSPISHRALQLSHCHFLGGRDGRFVCVLIPLPSPWAEALLPRCASLTALGAVLVTTETG